MGIPFDHPAIVEAISKGLISVADLPGKHGRNPERAARGLRQKDQPAERCERPADLTTTDPVFEGQVMADGQPTPAHVPNQSPEYRPDPVAMLAQVPTEFVVVRATHVGEPIPKHRPRYTSQRGHIRAYTPASTREHRRHLEDAARQSLGAAVPDARWAFGIRAVFYVGTYQRKDTDNMLKAVLDAMNKLVFADDSQVKETMAWTVLDIANPRTEFIAYRMYPIDRETGLCLLCGKEFRRFKSWRARRYCSRKCVVLATTTAQAVPCAECGKELVRGRKEIADNKSGKFYCSGACIGLHNRRETNCGHCGAALSRPSSWTKDKQTAFYCNKACSGAAQTGRRLNAAPGVLSDRSRRAWVTRRAKAAAAATG